MLGRRVRLLRHWGLMLGHLEVDVSIRQEESAERRRVADLLSMMRSAGSEACHDECRSSHSTRFLGETAQIVRFGSFHVVDSMRILSKAKDSDTNRCQGRGAARTMLQMVCLGACRGGRATSVLGKCANI